MTTERVMNAVEAWPLYDTVQIGIGQGSVANAAWYESFAELGNETEIPFFNQRNRAGVGPAYCNFDSSEHMSFGYVAYAMGVQFKIPTIADLNSTYPGLATQDPTGKYVTFADMLKHSSFRFQVSQDEKILANCMTLPGGGGSTGVYNGISATNPLLNSGIFHNLSNGAAKITNMFKFAEPIHMPRNVNVNGTLQFSNYARNILQQLQGPGYTPLQVNDGTGEITDWAVPAICQLRVRLFGRREVQQRNNLHN